MGRRFLCWLGWHRRVRTLRAVPVGMGWQAEVTCAVCKRTWQELWD